MANIKLIKNRIKSATNIAQITKAMELVAASKMRKAQAQALEGKLYAQKIYEMVLILSSRTEASTHPLLRKPQKLVGKRLVVLLTTNKGLCGSLNTNLFRFFIQQYPNTVTYEAITLGKKGASLLAKIGATLKADFSNTTSFVSMVPALVDLITREYINGTIDAVDIFYNDFINVVKQIPRKKTILPLTIDALGDAEPEKPYNFLIEPNVKEVFDSLLPHYVENQIRDAVQEAEASEHSARMIAMRSATDNALSFVDDLTLVYNKARQEKITYEISDLVTAALAVTT
jgi:F-type H+-transporting ATPase subunit gamma